MPDTPRVQPTPPPEPPSRSRESIDALDVVRFLVELFAFFTFAWWGATMWPFPGNIIAGIAAPAAAILVWALFVSPKAVVRAHPFVRAAVELLVFASATVAWWTMGQVWIGLAFAVVAIGSGVLVGRRQFT
ncbi:MAG: YrdB family protein [Microbacterium sp.]|uniref:YrdB family protein n=1 Tax=Microbacterium sp. TaxID=51671 RepID=UPI0039E48DD5